MEIFLQKLAIFAIAAMICVTIHAQGKGDMATGANLLFSTGSYNTNFGIGVKFQYNIIDPVRLEGLFTYFFENGVFVSMWDCSANGHYLIPVAGRVTVYPIAGMGIFGTKTDPGSAKYYSRNICINLGLGADFKLTDQLILNAGLSSKIVRNWNRLMFSAGIAYKF